MAAVRHLGFVMCVFRPRTKSIVFVGVYRLAKFCCNRFSSCDNIGSMQVLIFNEFGLKLPIHAPWLKKLFGDLPPKWGAASSRSPKGTALRRKSYTTYRLLRSALPFLHSLLLYPIPNSYALQCFSIFQTPQKCPLPLRHLHPHLIHGSFGPIRVNIPNGITIGSAAICS